jgi:serpin B
MRNSKPGRDEPNGRRRRLWYVANRVACLLALVLVVAAACAPVTTSPPEDGVRLAVADVPRASASPEDAAWAAAAINAFGLDMYRRVSAGADNVVFSPASIALALAMARAGAAGTTADEMDAVLYDVAADANAGWLNALDQALTGRSGRFQDSSGKPHDITLRIANAPFAQRGMTLREAYLEALASRFGAGLRLVDYVLDTEGARRLINSWVDEQTEHRIPELIVQGVLDPSVRLTLVNAIYLKAPWLTPFPDQATTSATFTRADGTTVEVPTMALTTSLRYAEGDGWRAVELPYVGDALAMTVIVPHELEAFEAGVDADGLAVIVDALADRQVALTFPRFGIETKVELADVLAAMGMPTAFSGAADFSRITDEASLYISDVIHQANIDVDEAGTEAAAATAVVMRETAEPGPPIEMHVDRPFLFALRDVPTGAVLFLGRVGDPSIAR